MLTAFYMTGNKTFFKCLYETEGTCPHAHTHILVHEGSHCVEIFLGIQEFIGNNIFKKFSIRLLQAIEDQETRQF